MIGDVHQAAVWFNLGAFDIAAAAVQQAFDLDRGAGLDFDTICFEVLRPGEGVAPEQADAPASLRLLVGRAKVTREPSRHSFIAELDRADLKRLRTLTREKHREQCPWARPMREAEVDDVIEELGPESAEAVLRKIVSEGG